MFKMFTIVGVSAALAVGVVALAAEPRRAEAAPAPTAAFEQGSSAALKAEPQPKASQDGARPDPCAGQTRPFISLNCVAPVQGHPVRQVRVTALESEAMAAPARL